MQPLDKGACGSSDQEGAPVVTRFAPSPNGELHLGHGYAAITAHDRARRGGGLFKLRIEDIDGARSRPELVAEYIADLEWLGLRFDGEVILQSARSSAHLQAGEKLKAMGLLYPCICTRSEIATNATKFTAEGPIYPGTCRPAPGSPPQQQQDFAGAAWRLDTARALAQAEAKHGGPLLWRDELRGEFQAQPAALGDVVILRKDAPASYHLAVVLDDAASGITHVVRGADLLVATHIHRLLQALLDLPVPIYHHHALLAGEDGAKLAKRRGSPSLRQMRESGADGQALADDLRSGCFPAGISQIESA